MLCSRIIVILSANNGIHEKNNFLYCFWGSAYALLRERTVRVTKKTWVYSAVSGVLVFLIASFLMLALNYGEASIVIPVANMSFVLALLVSVLLKMEALTLKKAVSILLAVISVMLLARV